MEENKNNAPQIIVNGDYVQEKHVEYEIGNVESGGIGVQIIQGSAPKPSTGGGRKKHDPKDQAEKQRELMTLAKCGGLLDGHIQLLFNQLMMNKWLGEDTRLEDFQALFSGRDSKVTIVWSGSPGKVALCYLMKAIVDMGKAKVPDGHILSDILEGHFVDTKGHPLTNMGNGDKPGSKPKAVADKMLQVLNIGPGRNSEPDDEECDSRYDPYDQQDLHLHNRRGNLG